MEEGERLGGSDEDLISGIPDELLHDILVRLRSAQAAARTSVLSRRWRHVWAHLPELRLVGPRAAAADTFLDTVDGALAGYLAPTLGHLSISVNQHDVSITAGRVGPWLQFAVEHMAAEIYLYLPPNPSQIRSSRPWLIEPEIVEDDKVLELPPCAGARRIVLWLEHTWRVQHQAAGLFTALTSLTICLARMGGDELTALVCTQCPCLRDLTIYVELIAVSDVSVHSNSLHTLVFHVTNTRRLEVLAPKLEQLTVQCQPMEAHISASKLVMVAWHSAYDLHFHRFADVGRSLRLLDTSQGSTALTKQFDEVDELKLRINIRQVGVTGYETFLNETNKLPKCKSIEIYLLRGNHALLPSVLQLLRNCSSTKKFSLLLEDSYSRPSYSCPRPVSYPCCLEESRNIDGTALSSLEELEIRDFTDSLENMELVQFLSISAAILKRLVIMFPAPPLTKEICEKIRSMCHRIVEVKFHVFRDAKLVPFD